MNNKPPGCRIEKLRKDFFSVVSEMNYSKQYQYYFEIRFNSLENYMEENCIRFYSPEIGETFLQAFLNARPERHGIEKQLKTFIEKVNDIYSGKTFVARHHYHDEKAVVLTGFQEVLDDYALFCLENGNKSSTISQKNRNCRRFCLILNDAGCNSVDVLNETNVIQTCLKIQNHDAWRFIREFLSYLFTSSHCKKDYSYLVPKATKKKPLPSVYTNEEVRQIEDAVDTSTPVGKRDFSIMLLESRLAIRSGDIVNFTFDNVDFINDRVKFIQEKTDKPVDLPLLPDVKSALTDYINHGRPASDDNHVFLRANAPHLPLTTAALRNISKKYMKRAEIDPAGRRSGPHSRRSSTATSMVNDGISYDVVKRVLGHQDPNAIKHYAALDKNKLRLCALPAPPPTGTLKDFMEGRVAL